MTTIERKIRFGIIFLILFLFLLLAPILFLGTNLVLGVWGIKKIETSLKKGDFADVEAKSFLVRDSFRRLNNFLKIGQPVFTLFGFGKETGKAENLFALADVSSEGLISALSAAEESNQILSQILRGENANFDERLRQIKIDLAAAFEKTSIVQSLITNFSGEESIFGPYVLRLKSELPQWRSLLWQSQELANIMPEILGINGRRTYLLLLQNNMELRPAGGFIGSYGLLTLEKGVLLDFEIQDVYFADGQLRGHVEPPAKLKEFLGQAAWFLRDSNWDPDFPTSSAQAEWFLEKETGRRVDGTIALNLFVAQRLLEVFGEIEIPDYKEKINAKNFFERAQFRSEVGFFPGSTAKSDFLGAVSAALFEEVKNANQKELLKIGLSLYQSLSEKDILVSLHDEKAARVMEKFNWDGALRQAQCPAKPDKWRNKGCLEDYLMIVEANVGVNKANYYLGRNLQLKIRIEPDESVEKTLTISYQNKSPSEIFPAGKYRNYLRLYIPGESTFIKCQIQDEACQVEQTFEHQKKAFGFLVEVPVGERRQVEFTWSLPANLGVEAYRLFFQKQSGTRNDSLTLSFSYPANWQIISKTAGALTGKQPLVYNTNLSQDKIFDLEFRKLY